MCRATVGRSCSSYRSSSERWDVQVYPGQTALVVSLENITENVYLGNQRSMTITNCLFRLGGAAALLSNKCRHWWTARLAQSSVEKVSAVFRILSEHKHPSCAMDISACLVSGFSKCTI